MDWKKHRLLIAGGVLVALLAVTVWKSVDRAQEETEYEEDLEGLWPGVAPEKVTELQVAHPEAKETVVLKKVEGTWQVVKPVAAAADEDAIESAVERLGELEVAVVAATSKANHPILEVDKNKGIAVEVIAEGGKKLAFFVGAYRGGNTMIRLKGEDRVVAMRGSLRHLFDKKLPDWRDKHVVDVTPTRVEKVSFQSANGSLAFRREGETWEPEKGQKPIKDFDADGVESRVSAIAKLNATDFGAEGLSLEAAGLAEPAATVTIAIAPKPAEGEEGDAAAQSTPESGADAAGADAEGASVTVLVGKKDEKSGNVYLKREDTGTIYLVSDYLAGRLQPSPDDFVKKEEEEAAEEAPGPPAGMPGGMPGGGAGQIPPEVMEQLQQQMGQQQ